MWLNTNTVICKHHESHAESAAHVLSVPQSSAGDVRPSGADVTNAVLGCITQHTDYFTVTAHRQSVLFPT